MASAKGARYAAMDGSQKLLDNIPRIFGELGTGYDTSQGQLGQAGGLYAGMAARGTPGLDKYDALTLGSGADISRALEGNAGYQFNMDQGLQALQRSRAAGGMLNSGNTDTDTLAFAQGLAGQQLGAERAALAPYLSMYEQGVGGQAGVLGQQAAGTTDYYTGRANVYDDTWKNIVGLGTEALKAGDAAKSQNQANAINIGTGLLKGGLSLATGGLGGGAGGLLGGFTKLFG